MTSSGKSSGGNFLAKKSDINKLRKELPSLKDVLVIEDENLDADRLKATLRVMFGYDLEVRRAATLAAAVDCVMTRKPDLVFLDDMLKPSDTALDSIPFLRRASFEGPIVVVSGQVTRNRRAKLMEAGASEVIHKDDVDSVRLAEALLRVLVPEKTSGLAPSKSAARKATKK
jgi:DNA-binding NarL/FixJ family response regulator